MENVLDFPSEEWRKRAGSPKQGVRWGLLLDPLAKVVTNFFIPPLPMLVLVLY